ncbi:histidinol-phosphate transaminase [Rhizobium cremeum]|uniref:histidinol-phosphate transaminase n=1 Tax=Rhizobium cremeum TaxID=2813827 RepID=UPI000DDF8DCB|nr:histidinol-phosphate transaminase [Rhizobium cremeum]MCJ7994422.1 histidinol-phosphate transaminase [Rhizobium cremeum]MCJ7999921.1 histidinol-phosphate transaminase [Rhizobium cremeum]
MSKFWSPIVTALEPYVAGEQPAIANLVKLNTNENPWGPSRKVLEAIHAAINDDLRRYPDPSARALKEAIARYHGVASEQVFVGNGSDEVLAFIFASLLKHDAPLLYPDITYSFYPTYSRLFDIETRTIPLDADYRIRPEDYNAPCGAIILPNPNAPTGVGLPLGDIERLATAHSDQVVAVDEAYVDFGGETAIPLIADHENVIVIRTFSKSRSLAGLRVGYAIAQRPLIEALERMKDSFNSYPLDRIAQVAAVASIEDDAWFTARRDELIENRRQLTVELENRSFVVLPSQANFVFARKPGFEGKELAAALRQRAVLVRHFNKPRIADFLRISIGTQAECRRLIEAMDDIL